KMRVVALRKSGTAFKASCTDVKSPEPSFETVKPYDCAESTDTFTMSATNNMANRLHITALSSYRNLSECFLSCKVSTHHPVAAWTRKPVCQVPHLVLLICTQHKKPSFPHRAYSSCASLPDGCVRPGYSL